MSKAPQESSAAAREWAARISAAWDKVSLAQNEGRRAAGPKPKNSDEILFVEQPLSEWLVRRGHIIERQVKCAGGRVDIVDSTSKELIECKASGRISSIVAAARQLKHYESVFDGFGMVIAVPRIDESADWMVVALRGIGFRFIEVRKLPHD